MIYIVTFEIHRDCQIRNYIFYCTAKNAKEACATARQAWTEEGRLGHQFDLHAVRSNVQDVSLLTVRHWAGAKALNQFVLTDFYTWRANGRNLYSF